VRPYAGAFQSTFLGRFIRLISRDHLLKYPDEIEFPQDYTRVSIARKIELQQRQSSKSKSKEGSGDLEKVRKNIDGEKTQKITDRPRDVGIQIGGNQAPASMSVNSILLAPPIGSSESLALQHPFQFAATLKNPSARSGVWRSNSGLGSGSGEGDDATVADGEEGRAKKTAGEKRGQGENFQDERKEKTPVNTEEAEKGEDPNLITWYGEDDQENPWVLNSDQQGRS